MGPLQKQDFKNSGTYEWNKRRGDSLVFRREMPRC
nr:ribosomal protein S2 [Silene flos-cuculi]